MFGAAVSITNILEQFDELLKSLLLFQRSRKDHVGKDSDVLKSLKRSINSVTYLHSVLSTLDEKWKGKYMFAAMYLSERSRFIPPFISPINKSV